MYFHSHILTVGNQEFIRTNLEIQSRGGEKGQANYPTYPWLLQCLVSTNETDFKGHTSHTHHLFSPNTVSTLQSLNFKPAVWSTIIKWLSGLVKTSQAASSEQLKERKVKYPISLRWFFLTESKYTWWNCSWCVRQNKRLYSKRNIVFLGRGGKSFQLKNSFKSPWLYRL